MACLMYMALSLCSEGVVTIKTHKVIAPRGVLAPCTFSLSPFFMQLAIWSLAARRRGPVSCETLWPSPGNS